MKIQLYKYDGTPLFEVMVDASSSQSWSLMSDNKLSLSFELEECVVLTAGCYIEFDNTRFYLLTEYKPTMVCRSAWKYDLTLGDAASWLSITLALKTTDGENAPLFKYTGPAVEHAAIIVANLNRLMGTDKWKVGSVISTENITIDYSGKYCSEVLQEIVDIKNTEWWIDDMTLNIGRAEFGDPIELGYQNGLLGDIIREQSDNSKSYRYLYPVGSTRNIDPTKYGYDRLQLPDGRTYIDMNVEQGIAELFEEAAFAHIFPRYEGTVQTVRTQIANGNSGPFVIYYFSDSNIPFNPNDYEIAGLKKQISFLSGELMGEDFEVNYNPSSKEFEIITKYPESSNNIQLPGGLLIPNIGDKYVIWNITMPAEYYSLASQELLEAAEAFAQKYIYDGGIYHASLDYIDVQLRSLRLRPGQRVRLQSPEYFPKTGHYDSRITRVTRSLWNPNEMNIDISSERSMGVIKKLSSDVKSAQTKSNTLSATLSTLNAAFVAHKMLFDEFFEKDSAGNIHAKLSLWSSGGITAGGVGSGGSGGGGGISYSRLDSWADYSADKSGWVLSALLGKDLDNRVSALANAGYITASYLAPYALRSEIPSLVGYATETFVNTALTGYLPLNGGTLTGNVTAPTFTGVINSVAPTALFRAMSYTAGTYSRSASEEDGKIFIGSSVNNKVISSPHYDGTNTVQNIQSLRLAYNSSFFTEIATTPNSNHLWKRNVEADGANPWERFVTEKAGVTWNISITGNADSATKLATPRSIWGQSFDGTGNISGNLSSDAWRIVTDNSTQGVFVQAKLGDGTSDAGRVFITGFNGANLSLFNVWSATTRIKGNVGIGIDYPSEALHVNGNGKFTGALTANSLTIGGATITYDSVNEALCINGNMYALGGITAGGVGSGSASGGGVSYDRLDAWADYSADKSGWVLSALLGKELDDRVSALANAGYITQSALAPYALRSELPIITKDGLKSTLGISDWALASAKPTYTASEVGALGVNDTAINANKLGGYLPTTYMRASGQYTDSLNDLTSLGIYRMSGTIKDSPTGAGGYGNLMVVRSNSWDTLSQLYFNANNNRIFVRSGTNSNFTSKDWSTLAYISDIPTKLSQLTDDVVAGKYLPLSGGKLVYSGAQGIEAERTDGAPSHIMFIGLVNGTSRQLGGFGMNGYNDPVYVNPNGIRHKVLTAENYTDYALSKNGGTISDLIIDRNPSVIQYKKNGASVGYLGIGSELEPVVYNAEGNTAYMILHSGNYSNLLAGGTINGSLTATSFIGNLTGTADNANSLGGEGYRSFARYTAGNGSIGFYIPNTSIQYLGQGDGFIEYYDSGWYNAKWGKVTAVNGFFGNLAGNADSATKLATPRTIWGQSFDGTQDITGALTAPSITANSLTIGGATITYDSVNEALCINGNMYALGGITAGAAGISAYSSLEARVARLEQQLNI